MKQSANFDSPTTVAPSRPDAADLLAGSLVHTSTTAAANIVEIAAGKTWRGTITIVCDVANVAATGTTAGQALGVVTTAGTGVTPAAGTYMTCEARCGANAATGTVGSQGNNSVSSEFTVVAPAANAVQLQGASTIAGTAGRVAYSAAGTYI